MEFNRLNFELVIETYTNGNGGTQPGAQLNVLADCQRDFDVSHRPSQSSHEANGLQSFGVGLSRRPISGGLRLSADMATHRRS